MRNSPIAVRAAVLLALAVLAGTTGLASAQSEAYVSTGYVSYYFAHGTMGSSTMQNAAANTGTETLNATVCIKAQLRPELARGRVNLIAIVDDSTTLELDFEEFLSPNGVTPGVMTNLTLDSSFGQNPTLQTHIAAWGPVSLTANGFNVTDPVSSNRDLKLQGSFFVSKDGERDDQTKERLANGQLGDTEMHLRIRNDPDGTPVTLTQRITSVGQLPQNMFAPNEAYSNRFAIYNQKFGGSATADVRFTANAPAGNNELTFTFSSPTGKLLGETKVTAAMMADGAGKVEFPLNEFGNYFLEVRGKVALSRFEVNLAMAPPKALDLDIWWEDVVVGGAANTAMAQCRKDLGLSMPADSIVGRATPPSWFMEKVIVGIVGATAGVLLLVKIIADGAAALQLKRRFGR